MSYRIPIGPYHLALEEPYKIEVECEGETVVGASLKVGFNFRGIEWLAQHKNVTKTIALVERVCGICSNVHSMTFCMALERIGEIEVPEKAKYVRVAIAELERLHSHLLWAGVAAELVGFQTLFMHVFRLRELVMDALEAISGYTPPNLACKSIWLATTLLKISRLFLSPFIIAAAVSSQLVSIPSIFINLN